MAKFIEYRQLSSILAMFLIVQLSGLLMIFYLISPSEIQVVTGSTQVVSTGPDVFLYFIYLIVAAVVMVLLFRAHHGVVLFKVIEGVVIVSASFYVFLIIIASAFPQDNLLPVLISLALSVALVLAKNKWPGLRNLTAVIASIGVGVVLGISFSFYAAYVLMALISIYDYVAVFITKHMLSLGRESVNRNLAFMIGTYDVELVPKSYLKAKEQNDIRKAVKQAGNETLRRMYSVGNMPMPSFSALGAGDLAIPLMLAISAYATYLSYFISLAIIFGASFGIIFAMWVSKKYMIALPAIPPLFAFASMAIGLVVFFYSPEMWQQYVSLFVASFAILALMLITAKRQSKMGDAARINVTRTSS
jgi:presenilin-like A22 family membrane protease